MFVDSMFHLHTLEVLVVPFSNPRGLYSYSSRDCKYYSSGGGVPTFLALFFRPIFHFLFLFCALRRIEGQNLLGIYVL